MRLIPFLLLSLVMNAQQVELITYGLKLGAIHSKISNLPEMLTGRDHSLQQYTLKSEGVYGIETGFFANFKLYDTRVAIQPELLFRKAGEKVKYEDITGKTYEIGFDYSYLIVGASYKVYPLGGLNVGLGAFYGINLNSGNISYESNQFGQQFDTEYRQFYRDGIEGSNDFSLSFLLGYEFKRNFNIDFRYYLGISDALKTKNNSFQFSENNNKTSTFSFSVGYSFDKL
ncbi:outer membrane beta-barrel protein [Flavobacterium sp.]|uniref:outer membrane beta-barrel protein n=1 Tax=Flavobacterium sp. TaxID=239 RepID=UPI003C3A7309